MRFMVLVMCGVLASSCAAAVRVHKPVKAYLYTDGFIGEKHTYVRKVPFTTYSYELAEDACLQYTRAQGKEITSATTCQGKSYAPPNHVTYKSTLAACTTVEREGKSAEYCWVSDKSEPPWCPGMVLINKEATTITYGPIYDPPQE